MVTGPSLVRFPAADAVGSVAATVVAVVEKGSETRRVPGNAKKPPTDLKQYIHYNRT